MDIVYQESEANLAGSFSVFIGEGRWREEKKEEGERENEEKMKKELRMKRKKVLYSLHPISSDLSTQSN